MRSATRTQPSAFVFYPGAKVEYSAYAPLMRDLAERGYLAVVVQMPFNFAFFDINAADRVRADFPDVGTWWVGGHSLGGSMAAQYAVDHAGDGTLDGLVLLGSYSASDLSSTNLGAISLYGSNDQVLNRAKLEDNADLLPKGAETVEIEGGNHAGLRRLRPAKRRWRSQHHPRGTAEPNRRRHRPLHQGPLRRAVPGAAA